MTKISFQGVAALCLPLQNNSKLQVLRLAECGLEDSEVLELAAVLCTCVNLKALDLSGNAMGANSLLPLCEVSCGAKVFAVFVRSISRVFPPSQAVRWHEELVALKMDSCPNFTDGALKRAAPMLQSSPKLEWLSTQDCPFTDQCFAVLVRFFEENLSCLIWRVSWPLDLRGEAGLDFHKGDTALPRSDVGGRSPTRENSTIGRASI
eukprot:scaffold803_cov310-Pinguiococcus_pyrenoidosus.AAC.205